MDGVQLNETFNLRIDIACVLLWQDDVRVRALCRDAYSVPALCLAVACKSFAAFKPRLCIVYMLRLASSLA